MGLDVPHERELRARELYAAVRERRPVVLVVEQAHLLKTRTLVAQGFGPVEPVTRDKDIFGDGRVVMLDMPGHTPGHHVLLVRLAHMGSVLLSGDQAHFQENYDSNGVPEFNTDRAQTLASFDRFKALAKNLGATVIIQHEPRDLAKLPAFPKAAE